MRDDHLQFFNDFYLWCTNTIQLFKSKQHLVESIAVYTSGWCQSRKATSAFFQQILLGAVGVAEILWRDREELWQTLQRDPDFNSAFTQPRWRSEAEEQLNINAN